MEKQTWAKKMKPTRHAFSVRFATERRKRNIAFSEIVTERKLRGVKKMGISILVFYKHKLENGVLIWNRKKSYPFSSDTDQEKKTYESWNIKRKVISWDCKENGNIIVFYELKQKTGKKTCAQERKQNNDPDNRKQKLGHRKRVIPTREENHRKRRLWNVENGARVLWRPIFFFAFWGDTKKIDKCAYIHIYITYTPPHPPCACVRVCVCVCMCVCVHRKSIYWSIYV